MYQSYYGFSEKPFTITPNPHFLFLSKMHKEVFAHLLYGIHQRSGFIELIGEVGTGKTTVLRTLMRQLTEDDYRLAFIFNPSLTAAELLQSINREFGLPAGATAAELLENLNQFLLRENAAGRTVILVIDEAQNLEPSVLEQIRLLSNLETETSKLIQIILVGQPELAELLSRPGLRQLSQRITVRFRLQPMDFADTAAYIDHRLRIAGSQGRSLFTPAAVQQIYRWTGGLPRLINVLCDRALLVGYAENVRELGPKELAIARRELRREGAGNRSWWRHPVLIVLFPLLLLAGSAGWLLGRQPPAPLPSSAANIAASAAPTEVAIAESDFGRLRRALAAQSEGQSAVAAMNTLLPLWQLQPLPAGGPETIEQAARLRNLQLAPIAGSPAFLGKFGTPLILSLSLPEGLRYLAATRIDGNRVTVIPNDGGALVLTTEELRPFWSGRGHLVWKNHLHIPFLTTSGTTGEGVLHLQALLQETGFYTGVATGVYDETTIDAVRHFQAANSIAQDGEVGPQTLMLLYQNSHYALPAPEIAQGEKQ